jgi:hypothetical protein
MEAIVGIETFMRRAGESVEISEGQKITVLSAKNDRVTLLLSHLMGQQHEKRRETCQTIWGEFPVGE